MELMLEGRTLKPQQNKARYFRVTFCAQHPKGVVNGATMYVTDGTYLGCNETVAYIEKAKGLTNVVILAVTELTEGDYKYYVNN